MSHYPKILSLDVAGNPDKWITYEEAAYYYCKNLIAWQLGTDGYTLYGGTSRLTNSQSYLDINSIVAIKGSLVTRKHNYNVPPLKYEALFHRDNNTCAYCGRYFYDKQLTCDHIIPTSRHGKNTWMNAVAACGSCNKYKNDRTPEEADMPLLFQPYIPNRAEFLILTNRNLLDDQLDYLAQRVDKHSRIKRKIT